MTLTKYEKDRLRYLRNFQNFPLKKGGLDDNEIQELKRLESKEDKV